MATDKIVFWSLFDSGNGSYSKEAIKHENIENFSIGIDRENKNSHFINLDLSDFSRLFDNGGVICSILWINCLNLTLY